MKLDRAVSNTQWMDLFGSVKALTLPKTHSDHHPVCVRCLSPSKKNDERRFFAFLSENREGKSPDRTLRFLLEQS